LNCSSSWSIFRDDDKFTPRRELGRTHIFPPNPCAVVTKKRLFIGGGRLQRCGYILCVALTGQERYLNTCKNRDYAIARTEQSGKSVGRYRIIALGLLLAGAAVVGTNKRSRETAIGWSERSVTASLVPRRNRFVQTIVGAPTGLGGAPKSNVVTKRPIFLHNLPL
jgi:hypothetical protein